MRQLSGVHFPFHYTPETDVPRHLRVRAEGLPLRKAVWSGIGYLRKYANAKFTAPREEVAYFDRQRQLLRWLAKANEEGTRLAVVGDLMWLRDGWHQFLAPEVLAYLQGHDAVIGNLETPISARFRVPHVFPDYFDYNSDPGLLDSFRRPDGRSTFSALATANNHCLDRGDVGLGDTLGQLDARGIAHAGVRRKAGEKPYVVFESGGIRIGFYSACWGLNNPALIAASAHQIEVLAGLVPRVVLPVDIGRIREALAGMASEGVEFRIVSLHWGHEFEFYPVPELMQVGRDIIRAGADLLVGTHPHVVQPCEVCFVNGYGSALRELAGPLEALESEGCAIADGTGIPRKGLIAYSLGNFATAMYTLHCRIGLILSLHLKRNASGRVDWHRPEAQFVYNLHRDPRLARRRLVLLEGYLRECERAGDGATHLRRMARYLERHLFGEP